MEVSSSPTFWASEATLRLQPALEEGVGSAYLFEYVQDAPLIRLHSCAFSHPESYYHPKPRRSPAINRACLQLSRV